MVRGMLGVAFAALATVVAAGADSYKLTGDNTKITFVGTKPGGKHDGGFKKLSGTATVADSNVETMRIEVEIDTDSLYTDDPSGKLTGHLKNPDFFGVKDNPKATFKTTKVERTDKGYTITGDLTMIGKTKSVSFPATATVSGDTLTLNADFSIDRTDWGMNYGKGKIDDKVALKVVVNAKK